MTSRKIGIILVAEQAVAVVSVFAYNYAIAHGPITLISSVGATQPLFVLLFATILSFRFPQVLREGTHPDGCRLEGTRTYRDLCGTFLSSFSELSAI